MPTTQDEINLLLISEDSRRSSKLLEMLADQGILGDMRQMRASRSASACARRNGRYRQSSNHDMVLIDFSEPDDRSLAILRDIALGPDRPDCPVIVLTSEESELLLDSGNSGYGDSNMFAPTSLACFLKKMRQHSRGRFLRALNVISNVGPVLVRLPVYFMRDPNDLTPSRFDGLHMRQVA